MSGLSLVLAVLVQMALGYFFAMAKKPLRAKKEATTDTELVPCAERQAYSTARSSGHDSEEYLFTQNLCNIDTGPRARLYYPNAMHLIMSLEDQVFGTRSTSAECKALGWWDAETAKICCISSRIIQYDCLSV